MIKQIGRILTLKQAVAELGEGVVSVKTLRAEVHAGRLKACRARPSRNSRILLTEAALVEWWETYAAFRRLAA